MENLGFDPVQLLNTRGRASFDAGSFTKAQRIFGYAYVLNSMKEHDEHISYNSFLLSNLASATSMMGDTEFASELFSSALSDARMYNKIIDAVRIEVNLGTCCFQKKEYQKALVSFMSAYDSWFEVRNNFSTELPEFCYLLVKITEVCEILGSDDYPQYFEEMRVSMNEIFGHQPEKRKVGIATRFFALFPHSPMDDLFFDDYVFECLDQGEKTEDVNLDADRSLIYSCLKSLPNSEVMTQDVLSNYISRYLMGETSEDENEGFFKNVALNPQAQIGFESFLQTMFV